jgi:hypothetical protein
MVDISFNPEFSIDVIVAFLAIIVAIYLTSRQIAIMDAQRIIFARQTEISELMKFYQG